MSPGFIDDSQMSTQVNGSSQDADISVSALLQSLYSAPDGVECERVASKIASHVNSIGLDALSTEGILSDLLANTRHKSGLHRESALIGLATLFSSTGAKGGADPFYLPIWPDVLERFQEVGKAQVVADAAELASRALLNLVKPECTIRAMHILFNLLENSSTKWRVKVGALEAVAQLTSKGQAQVAECLGEIIPRISRHMSDTKSEVSAAASQAASKVCAVLTNPDVVQFVPLLVECKLF